MDRLYVADESSFLSLHPLTLLAQITAQKQSGCLAVYSGAESWRLYLEQGDLVYASTASHAFERLDRHLRNLSRSVPSLVSAVRVQVRLLFETRQASYAKLSPDYQAIQWLVDQQYLAPSQAAALIRSLAQEVLSSLLSVTTGNYDVIDRSELEGWFSVCRLDLRQLIADCEAQNERTKAFAQRPLLGESRSSLVSFPSVSQPLEQSSEVSSALVSTHKSLLRKDNDKTQYRIVCVDDSPTILKLINSYLDDSSFSVFMINDPVRALMQVMRYQPDLVLLDVEMPNLDGYELCSLLRRHPRFKSTPILMVTGNTGFLDRARAKLVGSSGYLTKPFTRSDLMKIVFRNLPGSES